MDAEPPLPAYSQVVIYNCSDSRREITIYKRDLTTGGNFELVGALESQWDTDNIQCPKGGAQPMVVNLADKHVYEFVAVDAGSIGCIPIDGDPSDADPETLSCRRDTIPHLVGKTGAGILQKVIA